MIPQTILYGSRALQCAAPSLLAALEMRAQEPGPWLTFYDGSRAEPYSGAALAARARQWSEVFVEAEIPFGSRVGIWHPNSPDFVASFFGAMGAGLVPVPLPWPVLESNLTQALHRLEPVIRCARIECVAAPARAAIEGSPLRWPFPHSAAGPVANRFPNPPAPSDTAFIQFTSGSTGQPRGAVISQHAALYNAQALVAGLGLCPSDIGVSWVPFFHDMGLIGVLLASLAGGFQVHVLRPSAFLLHPWHWLELASAVKATLTVGPDFGYALATRRSGDRAFSLASLTCAITGSEPIHESTLNAFSKRFAVSGFRRQSFVGAYGLAENTLGVSVGAAAVTGSSDRHGRSIPSVGTPLPGMTVAIEAVTNEIYVRSPSMMSGYFEAPEETARTLVDGWLRTGDLGVIADGTLQITGREKELVIRAGRKFHPSEIEQLVAHAVDAPPNGVFAFERVSGARDELVLVVEQRRVDVNADGTRLQVLIADALGLRIDRVEWVAAGRLPRTTSGKLRRSACAQEFGSAR